MKNLATYLDDFINEEENYFEKCKTKKSVEKKNVKKEFLSEGYTSKKKNKSKHRKEY